jgi:NAD(P)-dependent dehydrogenase (short-subunit alcohol dehydrogenase family)
MSKTAIVTGANTGMGKETARDLARKGMVVVMACRNLEKGEAARAEIMADTGASGMEVVHLDLASKASIRAFVNEFTRRHERLDVLVNNGGVSLTEFTTSEGIETTIATNHLGPFLLTNLLLPALKASAPSRVVTVSSVMHKRARFDLADFDGSKHWSSYFAYNNSKLLNVLFTMELARRCAGTGVTVNCLNPGLVNSDFFRYYARLPLPLRIVKGLLGTTPAAGARTSAAAQDAELACKVWEVSARLTGLSDS